MTAMLYVQPTLTLCNMAENVPTDTTLRKKHVTFGRRGWKLVFPPIEQSGVLKLRPRVNFHVIICERDRSPRTTRCQKYAKFYGEHFLSYKFFYKSSSFRIIGINVKFSLRS